MIQANPCFIVYASDYTFEFFTVNTKLAEMAPTELIWHFLVSLRLLEPYIVMLY